VDLYTEDIYIGNKCYFIKPDILAKLQEPHPVFDAAGIVVGKVTPVAKEKYAIPPEVEAMEKNRERLSFEMQLNDLEKLLKLTLSGASNAIFVAGRGGVGKTHTVEKILAELGKRDGDGYFKNTGSASTAGLYSLLFKHRDGIVLFDDSDDALKDQSSRNLLKAATDTKKVRKMVWSKNGSNVADPDEMTYDEIESEGLIPKYFEFTGKVIFISNLSMDRLDPDGALRTRAFIVDIDPTDDEVYDFMEKICLQMELDEGLSLSDSMRLKVVDFLRNSKNKANANLRKLSRGLNMAAGAVRAGLSINDKELQRLIEAYA
jgi:hypothetical protein